MKPLADAQRWRDDAPEFGSRAGAVTQALAESPGYVEAAATFGGVPDFGQVPEPPKALWTIPTASLRLASAVQIGAAPARRWALPWIARSVLRFTWRALAAALRADRDPGQRSPIPRLHGPGTEPTQLDESGSVRQIPVPSEGVWGSRSRPSWPCWPSAWRRPSACWGPVAPSSCVKSRKLGQVYTPVNGPGAGVLPAGGGSKAADAWRCGRRRAGWRRRRRALHELLASVEAPLRVALGADPGGGLPWRA